MQGESGAGKVVSLACNFGLGQRVLREPVLVIDDSRGFGLVPMAVRITLETSREDLAAVGARAQREAEPPPEPPSGRGSIRDRG